MFNVPVDNRFTPLDNQPVGNQYGVFLGSPIDQPVAHWKYKRREKKRKRGRRSGRRTQKKQTSIGTGIYNLSDINFNKEEIRVLDKGLKYAPIKNLNKFDTYVHIQKYVRTLN